MSVKSDKWILRMCREQEMISPFEEKLVREVEAPEPERCFYCGRGDWEVITGKLRCLICGNQVPLRRRIISAGLSSYGYDLRLAEDGFRVFSPIASAEIDPKNFDDRCLIEAPLRTADDGSRYWLLPPHSYALGVTVETFKIPRNVIAVVYGKSTYARAGLIVNFTVAEPEWQGRLVLEISNSANVPLRVYALEGIAQAVFHQSDEDCQVSYADRAGKYQNQTGLVTPKV